MICGRLHVSRGYCVRAHFTVMPSDDRPLENWLKAQPGVVSHTVHAGRKDDDLHVMFIMSQTVTGNPPFPWQGLSDTCASLGYEPASDWKDDKLPISF
jgi:hypothetical protein